MRFDNLGYKHTIHYCKLFPCILPIDIQQVPLTKYVGQMVDAPYER